MIDIKKIISLLLLFVLLISSVGCFNDSIFVKDTCMLDFHNAQSVSVFYNGITNNFVVSEKDGNISISSLPTDKTTDNLTLNFIGDYCEINDDGIISKRNISSFKNDFSAYLLYRIIKNYDGKEVKLLNDNGENYFKENFESYFLKFTIINTNEKTIYNLEIK